MLTIESCSIPDVKILRPKLFHDDRGFVAETLSERRLAEHGITTRFVQENLSFSKKAGTLRGLHFQKPPHAQAKLIRVVRGKIFDIALDVRPNSPTYGQHVGVTLSEEDVALFLIPRGFAHGFCTLTDDTTVLYKVDSFYAPESEGGVKWNDPALGIEWPMDLSKAILSPKDEILPPLEALAPLDWS